MGASISSYVVKYLKEEFGVKENNFVASECVEDLFTHLKRKFDQVS